MSNRHRWILFVTIYLLFITVGCRQKPTEESNDVSGMDTPVDAVVVQINDVNITQSEIETLVQQEMNEISSHISHMSEAYYKQREKETRKDAIEVLIAEYLLDEQVKRFNIQVSDQEIDERIALMAAKQKPPMSQEEYSATIKDSGRTIEAFRKELKRDLAWYKLYERQWAGKLDVTEAQIKDYYDKHQADYHVPEKVRVSHIFIDPKKVAPGINTQQAQIQARQHAEQLLKEIRDGADFEEMARAHSHESQSAINGGDVGYFQRGDMEPSFEKTAFALVPDQISDIVETRHGLHIIKATDHQEASLISLEGAREDILEKLTSRKKTQIIKDYIQSLKEQANVTYRNSSP